MKKMLCMLLTAALLLCCAPAALAAEDPALDAADTLNALGLFNGTGGTDASGTPVYELDRVPNRAEALAMLIRLIGEEEAALSSTASHPFTDVPPWADRYVAYAYERQLTNGISKTEFGAAAPVTEQMYLTFVLRALGYSDTGETPDFSYREAGSYAAEKGLPGSRGDDLLRGDMAIISVAALEQPLNGEATTLIQSLAEAGAVDAQTAADRGFAVAVEAEAEPETETETEIEAETEAEIEIDDERIPKGKPVWKPVRSYGPDIEWAGSGSIVVIPFSERGDPSGVYDIQCEDILQSFPTAAFLAQPNYSEELAAMHEYTKVKGLSRELSALEDAVFLTLGYGLTINRDLRTQTFMQFHPDALGFVLDANYRVIGFYDPVGQENMTAVFEKKTYDASLIRDTILDLLTEELSHCWDAEVSVASFERQDNLILCNIALNGIPLSELNGSYRVQSWYSSQSIWDIYNGEADDEKLDSFLCSDIYQIYFQFSTVADENGFAVRSNDVCAFSRQSGQRTRCIVVNNETDHVVGYTTFITP